MIRYRFLLPPIHKLPTGGNIYNRKIVRFLKQETDVETIIWNSQTHVNIEIVSESKETITIVDSLLICHVEEIRSLCQNGNFRTLILLVHYLHLLNPERTDSAEARREKEALEVFDGFITTSQFSKDALICNGISPEIIKVARPGLENKYHRRLPPRDPDQIPQILTIASVLLDKGFLELLEILESMQDLSWNWNLVGESALDSGFAARFRKRLGDSPVMKRIRFHGPLLEDQVIDMYDQCHLFVLPSKFESCSMVAMEAMARGLPVIAYNVGGLSENIPRPEVGCLISPGDTEMLSKKLRTLIKSPAQRRSMGQEARHAGEAFLSWERMGRRFHEFITAILNESSRTC